MALFLLPAAIDVISKISAAFFYAFRPDDEEEETTIHTQVCMISFPAPGTKQENLNLLRVHRYARGQ